MLRDFIAYPQLKLRADICLMNKYGIASRVTFLQFA